MPFHPDMLTIVDCGGFYAAQVRASAYACPANNSAGGFPNNQYLGLGWHGAVRCIGQLQGMVDIDLNTDYATVVCNNETARGLTDEQLVQAARHRLRLLVHQVLNVQRIFVLQALFPTEFGPPTPGELLPPRRCLPVRCVQAHSAEDLARKLTGKTWDNYCG
jgi:hypothetical protein